MEWTRSGDDLFIRLDPGEEIHQKLCELTDEIGINAAAITSGIGRTRENIYGYMNEEGVYQRRDLVSPSELVSLSGNIARTEEGAAFTHIHCCWSDDDNNVHDLSHPSGIAIIINITILMSILATHPIITSLAVYQEEHKQIRSTLETVHYTRKANHERMRKNHE